MRYLVVFLLSFFLSYSAYSGCKPFKIEKKYFAKEFRSFPTTNNRLEYRIPERKLSVDGYKLADFRRDKAELARSDGFFNKTKAKWLKAYKEICRKELEKNAIGQATDCTEDNNCRIDYLELNSEYAGIDPSSINLRPVNHNFSGLVFYIERSKVLPTMTKLLVDTKKGTVRSLDDRKIYLHLDVAEIKPVRGALKSGSYKFTWSFPTEEKNNVNLNNSEYGGNFCVTEDQVATLCTYTTSGRGGDKNFEGCKVKLVLDGDKLVMVGDRGKVVFAESNAVILDPTKQVKVKGREKPITQPATLAEVSLLADVVQETDVKNANKTRRVCPKPPTD